MKKLNGFFKACISRIGGAMYQKEGKFGTRKLWKITSRIAFVEVNLSQPLYLLC